VVGEGEGPAGIGVDAGGGRRSRRPGRPRAPRGGDDRRPERMAREESWLGTSAGAAPP
jgi:hypothetical protein